MAFLHFRYPDVSVVEQRYLGAIVFGLLVASCGPSDSFAVDIKNDYAESIFDLDYSTDGASTWNTVFDSLRLDAGEQSDEESVELDGLETFSLRVDATSLGDTLTWIVKFKITGPGAFLHLIYDYDLALAKFRLRHSLQDLEYENE